LWQPGGNPAIGVVGHLRFFITRLLDGIDPVVPLLPPVQLEKLSTNVDVEVFADVA
jgi:hypothetical protein